jgi:hypothetical protein
MSASADVLVSTLQQLLPGYQETFTKAHPILNEVASGKGVETLSSHMREWILVSSDPGQWTTVTSGAEPLNGGRLQDSRRAVAFPYLAIYTVDIPLQDLRLAKGEMDFGKLIESYPERSLLGMQEGIASQIAMGLNSNLPGLFTLNGQQNYTPMNSTNQGIFEFAAPASQTGTIYGHARNSFPGWYNQYRHVSAMGTNGLKQIRGLHKDCMDEGQTRAIGGPKCWLADGVSFENFLDEVGNVVVVNDKQGSDPQSGQNARESIPLGLGGARLFNEPAIRLTDFTAGTAPADGVMYAVDTEAMDLFRTETGKAEYDGKGTTNKLITMRNTGVLQDRDAYRLQFLFSLGCSHKQLRSSGVVTGTAVA